MNIDYSFSVAPMMGYTTPHGRYLYRLMSKKAVLFTEMVASKALIKGNQNKLLFKNKKENPIILQVGGSDDYELRTSSELAEKLGFDGINLNIGCPSKKVQKGKFGVCLMKEPKLVNRLIKSMKNETNLDVSVKCRTGVDNSNKYEFLKQFVNEVSNAGCNIFFVHARKALLKGLNPAQNRTIPKLEYEKVYKLKEDFPENKVIINGGINCIEKFKEISKNLDGIMVGRLIQKNPFILLNVDEKIFGMKKTEYNKFILIKKYFEYMKNNIAKQSPYYLISPLLSLYFGQPGAKIWRKKINDLIRYKKFDNLEDICSNLV